MTKKHYRIVAFSDWHIGSILAPWPAEYVSEPDPRTGDRQSFRPNRTMRVIGQFLEQAIPKAVKGADIILWAGDLCDGIQKKSQGKYTVTNDLNLQEAAAIYQTERLIKDPPPMFYVHGTDYHAEQQRPMERTIARHFGAEFGDDLLIEECDIRIYMNHFVPITRSVMMYRTTPVARDLMTLALHNSPEEYGDVDLMVRGHAHYKCAVVLGSQTGVILPCYQARTPYAVKRGILSPPDIGYTIINIDRPQFGQSRPTISVKFVTKKLVRPCRIVGRQAQPGDPVECWDNEVPAVVV